jgi:adenylate kinase family enzyme
MSDRILVYGVTGSGKTFLAERISAATGIPWHAVDDLTWEPGWVLVPEDEQRRRIEPICASDRWVLDTAYGAWLEVPLARADLIVALDYPRWLSLSRLLRRSLARAIDGRPICNGNRESFRNLFQRDSIVAWHFRSFSRKRTRMRAWEADPGLPQVLRFTQPAQVQRWLRTLAPSGELSEPVADPGA